MREVRQNTTFFFDDADRDTAEGVIATVDECGRLIVRLWGVPMPDDVHVHVMTSWPVFVFRSAPWHWKLLLGLTLPVWGSRAAKIWTLAGGWELSYGRRRTVGVKPSRLLELARSTIGRELFEPERSMDEKLRGIVCHELTHAFTSHLGLPVWLKEGLAMLTVDRYLGRETVRQATLSALSASSGRLTPRGRARLDVDDRETLVYLYIFGYWLTRYLDETAPGALRDLLARRRRPDQLEALIAAAVGSPVDEYRATVDARLAAHFADRDRPVDRSVPFAR
jgi:hypothetical protein